MRMSGTRLYVGNLSYRTTDATLRSAFEQDGRKVVHARVGRARATGASRGFGFVELSSPAEAQAAISSWDGKDLEGRKLKVAVAEDRPGGGGGRGGGGGGGGRGGFGGGGG